MALSGAAQDAGVQNKMFGVFHDALDYGPLLPDAATRNPALYELLVLFDAIRGGSPRERAIALQLLDERLTS